MTPPPRAGPNPDGRILMVKRAKPAAKRGLGHGVGGAVREHQLGLDETAHRIADEIKQRQQLAGGDLRNGRGLRGSRFDEATLGGFACAHRSLCHQDLVQRAAAWSS